MDESTLDAVQHWLKELRALPAGDPALLAGRLACLFDVRRQQWVRIDWLPQAVANCQAHAQAMLEDVAAGTLLLFDLGYYSFHWFDTLTQRDIWWVARLRGNASYTIEHVLVQRDGYLEALVFVGRHRADRMAYLSRLVQVRYRGQCYRYLTNCLDPLQLPGVQVVQLYARRWDIELGFRLLKEQLGLRLLWSAKAEGIGAQLWATVTLAQHLHALQVQVAHETGVETFDVSLELLWRYWPELTQRAKEQSGSLSQVLKQVGVFLQVIRPHSRIKREVPQVSWQEISPPPVDLQWKRTRAMPTRPRVLNPTPIPIPNTNRG